MRRLEQQKIKRLKSGYKLEGVSAPYIYLGFIDNKLCAILSEIKVNPEYRSFKNSVINTDSLPISINEQMGRVTDFQVSQNILTFSTCQ